RQHRPDEEDLAFCRRHGFFAMPVPRELGGEGRPKIDYYLLTTNAQRIADVSVSLAIQASTSIGTTPVLLARDKDLPRALLAGGGRGLASRWSPGFGTTQRARAATESLRYFLKLGRLRPDFGLRLDRAGRGLRHGSRCNSRHPAVSAASIARRRPL